MREIACAILDFGNNQIGLQLRDYREGVEFSGKVSFFGGELESSETPIDALRREILEELTLNPSDYSIQEVGVFNHTDGNNSPSIIYLYILSNFDFYKIRVQEGHLCLTNIEEGIGEISLIESLREGLQSAVNMLEATSSQSCVNSDV